MSTNSVAILFSDLKSINLPEPEIAVVLKTVLMWINHIWPISNPLNVAINANTDPIDWINTSLPRVILKYALVWNQFIFYF